MHNNEILNLPIGHSYDFEGWTIKDYLKRLLSNLWEEGEGFSGKRPFGNSGWEYDLYKPLVKAGIINGSVDEEGDLEDCDNNEGYTVIHELINYLFEKEK